MGKAYKNKWSKFKILKESKKLSSALPETQKFSKQNLWKMVEKYKEVILKPVGSKGGEAILQLTSLGHGKYEIHAENKKKVIIGKRPAFTEVHKALKKDQYIIQRRIDLATIRKRPFDLRVMVQRGKTSPWTVTGKLAKLAGKGYLVTNIKRSKGKVLSLEHALQQSSAKRFPRTKLLSKVDDISVSSAQCLGKSFPGLKTVGMDLGIDQKGKVWVIEANFFPDVSLFLKLKNRKMFLRIKKWEKK